MSAIADLTALLVELRAEDDKLVLAGRLEPLDDEQARRLGLYRPKLRLVEAPPVIRALAEALDEPELVLDETGDA